jgi:hypothetical protein
MVIPNSNKLSFHPRIQSSPTYFNLTSLVHKLAYRVLPQVSLNSRSICYLETFQRPALPLNQPHYLETYLDLVVRAMFIPRLLVMFLQKL